MPTLLIFGARLANGDRDSYVVQEDPDTVASALEAGTAFARFTDPGDDSPVWFRVQSIRYFYEH